MSDILFFTLDDLGHRQAYVIAIFAIVLLAIAAVLLRDAWAWFEALGEEGSDNEDEALELEEPELADGPLTLSDRSGRAPAFIASAPPAFGRRYSEAA